MGCADVRDKTNACFWHRYLGSLGNNTQKCGLCQSHASTHCHTVHQCNQRLLKRMKREVEAVLVDEKSTPICIACRRRKVQRTHISTGAKTPPSSTEHYNSDNLAIHSTALDHLRQFAHHVV